MWGMNKTLGVKLKFFMNSLWIWSPEFIWRNIQKLFLFEIWRGKEHQGFSPPDFVRLRWCWGGGREKGGRNNIFLILGGFCHLELAPDIPRDTIKLNVEILWLNYPVPEITRRDETWLRSTCSPVTDILGI